MSNDHGDGAATAIAVRVRRVEALLEQRGLVNPVELDRALTAFLSKGSRASGARVVARAWAPGSTTASGSACCSTRTPRSPRSGCR